jgi:hypothetical protein
VGKDGGERRKKKSKVSDEKNTLEKEQSSQNNHFKNNPFKNNHSAQNIDQSLTWRQSHWGRRPSPALVFFFSAVLAVLAG